MLCLLFLQFILAFYFLNAYIKKIPKRPVPWQQVGYTVLLMKLKLGITLAHQILGLAQKKYLNTSKLADLAELITKSYITSNLQIRRQKRVRRLHSWKNLMVGVAKICSFQLPMGFPSILFFFIQVGYTFLLKYN